MLESLDEKALFITEDILNKDADYSNSVIYGGFFGLTDGVPTTQKARGIFFLQDRQSIIRNNFPNWRVPKHLLFSAGVEFDDFSFDYPVFARPCPTVPRHGFVDSIICRNGEELNALSKQTHEVEPLAELLVTKPVESSYNVIINGGVITFAAGNDGATSGRGCHYFYISDDPIGQVTKLNQHNIIAENEVPFYEFVLDKQDISNPVRLVQVRSAPHTPRVKDFVPAPVKVVNVLKAEGDLLAWESLLKTVDPATTIVDHTDGSLSSHYAIHAIINKVPIFTSYLPPVGALVEPTVEDTNINSEDEERFFKAFVLGFDGLPQILQNLQINSGEKNKNLHSKMTKIMLLSLATLHNFSSLALSKDYEILGVVLGMFCRTAFAVSAGEARHAGPAAKEKFTDFYKHLPSGDGRGPCYDFMMMADTKFCVENANTILRIFSNVNWTSGYGGKKWASCTRSAITLFNACVNKQITKVVELFNQVLNEEHNGGKYLNKIISVDHFDTAAEQPAVFTLTNLHTIVDFLHTAWSLKPTSLNFEFFKEIVMDPVILTNKKGVPLLNPDIFLVSPGSGSTLFKSVTFQIDGDWHQLNLPSVVDSGSGCYCSECYPSKLINITGATPKWWTLEDGTKIISKVKLKQIVGAYKSEWITKNAKNKSNQSDPVTSEDVENFVKNMAELTAQINPTFIGFSEQSASTTDAPKFAEIKVADNLSLEKNGFFEECLGEWEEESEDDDCIDAYYEDIDDEEDPNFF